MAGSLESVRGAIAMSRMVRGRSSTATHPDTFQNVVAALAAVCRGHLRMGKVRKLFFFARLLRLLAAADPALSSVAG